MQHYLLLITRNYAPLCCKYALCYLPHIISLTQLTQVNAGLSIIAGSNPRQLIVIGFGKCTGSLSHTVADPSPHILMHNFM